MIMHLGLISLTLAITDAGLAAIKVETEDAEPDHASPQTNKRARKPNKLHPSRRQVPKTSTVAARPTTKQETLVNLLKQNKGTTLAEIMAATGWQAHSVRGAISGTVKKRLGLPVSSAIEDDRGRVYRIVARD